MRAATVVGARERHSAKVRRLVVAGPVAVITPDVGVLAFDTRFVTAAHAEQFPMPVWS